MVVDPAVLVGHVVVVARAVLILAATTSKAVKPSASFCSLVDGEFVR